MNQLNPLIKKLYDMAESREDLIYKLSMGLSRESAQQLILNQVALEKDCAKEYSSLDKSPIGWDFDRGIAPLEALLNHDGLFLGGELESLKMIPSYHDLLFFCTMQQATLGQASDILITACHRSAPLNSLFEIGLCLSADMVAFSKASASLIGAYDRVFGPRGTWIDFSVNCEENLPNLIPRAIKSALIPAFENYIDIINTLNFHLEKVLFVFGPLWQQSAVLNTKCLNLLTDPAYTSFIDQAKAFLSYYAGYQSLANTLTDQDKADAEFCTIFKTITSDACLVPNSAGTVWSTSGPKYDLRTDWKAFAYTVLDSCRVI